MATGPGIEDQWLEEKKEWSFNDIKVDYNYQLGKGKFGIVFEGRFRKNCQFMALKVLSKDEIDDSRMNIQVERELKIQTRLRHPNILRLYGYFEDVNYIYMVLEHALKGTLRRHMERYRMCRLNEKMASTYMYHLADALNYCHSQGIIHRDIKSDNLLITQYDELKIADFGWAVEHDPNTRRRNTVGTLDYLAPEIIKGIPYNHGVDLWSFGVVCYECLTGKLPFYNYSVDETCRLISEGIYNIPSHVSEDAQDLIKKLLIVNYDERISAQDSMCHSWLIMNRRIERDENPAFFWRPRACDCERCSVK